MIADKLDLTAVYLIYDVRRAQYLVSSGSSIPEVLFDFWKAVSDVIDEHRATGEDRSLRKIIMFVAPYCEVRVLLLCSCLFDTSNMTVKCVDFIFLLKFVYRFRRSPTAHNYFFARGRCVVFLYLRENHRIFQMDIGVIFFLGRKKRGTGLGGGGAGTRNDCTRYTFCRGIHFTFAAILYLRIKLYIRPCHSFLFLTYSKEQYVFFFESILVVYVLGVVSAIGFDQNSSILEKIPQSRRCNLPGNQSIVSIRNIQYEFNICCYHAEYTVWFENCCQHPKHTV